MPCLSMAQVLHRLDQDQVAPLYVLFGDETYLMQEYTATLIARILAAASRDFNCDVFYAEHDTLAEVLSIADTVPMMASHRVVVLHGVQQLRKTDLRQLEQYAEQPSDTTALICSSTERVLNKLPTQLRQKAVAVSCQRLERDQLHDWVVRTVAKRHQHISDEAVRLLLQEQENDLQTLVNEINKLCTYAGEREEISYADVQEVSQALRSLSLFTLSDAIGTRQIAQALTVIERLLHQGEPPLVIFGLIVRHLRLLWSVKQLLQERQNIGRMAKTLSLPQPVCRQLAAQSQHFSPVRLQRLYATAVEADLAFKTSNKPPQAILEGLIFALCVES